MKVGSRLACDKCGRIESSSLKVYTDPSNATKHLCEHCKQTLYYQKVANVAKKSDSTRML